MKTVPTEVRSRARVALSILVVAGIHACALEAAEGDRRLLYVVAPGIRDWLEFGGAGVLVFDIDHGHQFVKRIETPASKVDRPENIKGVCASATTRRLYFSTLTKLYCMDLVSERTLWEKALPGGCDRMSITPNGQWLYVPSLEGPHWHVVDGASGEVAVTITPNSGAHNTVVSLDGKEAYLAGLKSPLLTVVDCETKKVSRTVGPFSAASRPFTVNSARTRCFVNVNELLGFEIGDLATGKKLARVEVKGFPFGTPARHGCPSHGVGLSTDETEVWVCDAFNRKMHVFDVREETPRQTASIALREEPGWITFSIDGAFAYPSTGEVIDSKTKRILAVLTDEKGRQVHSEKMMEIDFAKGFPIRAGNQFGLGRKRSAMLTLTR